MSKAPAMPMYWDAYLADTTHLTTEEHGAYMLLLAAMWRRDGSVPDDDRDNARIIGLTVAKWRKIKARLSVFLIVKDGMITQKNLQKIWENTQEKIDKNRENGAKGGRPKSKENNGVAKADGSVSVNPDETIPNPEPNPEDGKDKSSPSKARANFSDDDFSSLLRAVGYDPDGHIPAAWRDGGMARVEAWLSLGLDAAGIIAAAKASRSRHKDLPATPQALNSVMDVAAAKPAAPKPVSPAEARQRIADLINGNGPCPQSICSPDMARALIAANLVTAERLRERGIAA